MPKADPTPGAAQPTARQAEYLDFIRGFADRWGIPPSFEEIGRHFGTTAPTVSAMVKTLETRGFLTRVPGQARTLRVLVPGERQASEKPRRGRAASADPPASASSAASLATHLATLVIERLVPALKGASEEHLHSALDAVGAALEIVCVEAGAPPDERQSAQADLRRVALIARGMSPETRPGRRLPWWRRPR
jgi:SOS-response transcriptional repressor LexA